MEVKSLLAALEDIDNDVCSVSIDALQHAAEISPYITERTIGPDININTNEPLDDGEKENNKTSPAITSTPLKIKSKKMTPTPASLNKKFTDNLDNSVGETLPLSISVLQHIDLQVLVDSVRSRDMEAQRRQGVRKSVLDLQQKYNEVLIQCTEENLQKQRAAHNDWMVQKQRIDENIRIKAEQQAEEQLSLADLQLDSLLKKTQKQLDSMFCQGIVQYQRRFRMHYELVAKLLTPHEAKTEYNNKMKQLVQLFDQLIIKIKGTGCGLAELQVAEKLCLALESIEQMVVSALQQAEEEEKHLQLEQKKQQEIYEQQQQEEQQQQQQQQQQEMQQKQQEQVEKQAEQQQQQQPLSQLPTTQETVINESITKSYNCVSEERLAFYTHITTFYHEKVEGVKPLQADEAYKKFRFAVQKAINIPVNAISAFSAQHLRDKFEKLFSLIIGRPQKDGNTTFSTNDHPLGRDYCLLLMAKKFVNQGDTVISSNPQAAFPVASIIISLWKSVPDFGKIFLAYTFKESPFLVPYFIPQQTGQSVDDYYKALGYRLVDNKPEPQESYIKRQAGIARLYAAVMITGSAAQLDVAPHPYGIENAWRCLTNFIVLEPLPDICATILQEMLQIVGFDLWRVYGRQFVKLLLYLQQQYFPKLSAVDEGGPKARLELHLNKYLKEGRIPPPQGMLPPAFW